MRDELGMTPRMRAVWDWLVSHPDRDKRWAAECASELGVSSDNVRVVWRRIRGLGFTLPPRDQVSKVCNACKVRKPVTEFGIRGGEPRSECKPCHSRRSTEYLVKRYATDEDFRKRMNAYSSERRAAQRGLPSESVDRDAIFSRDKGRCWWCLCRLDRGRWHMDHLVPVRSKTTKADKHPGHVRWNLAASCVTCNIRRLNRHDAWNDVAVLKAWYDM